MEMPVDSPGKGNRVISGIELAEYVASTRADAINRSDATALIACTQENASCSGRSKMRLRGTPLRWKKLPAPVAAG